MSVKSTCGELDKQVGTGEGALQLADHGWSADDTAQLEKDVVELESDISVQADNRAGASDAG